MSTSTETSKNDPASRRLRMGILMSAVTVVLLVAWFVSPVHLKLALTIVALTTGVYAVFNLLMFRVRSRQSPA